MRNEEVPLLHIERNPLVLIISCAVSAVIVYSGYILLTSLNPWGFLMLVPALVLSLQSLWLLLNPFALIFKDKIEIKQSFFHHKNHYFVDIKKISLNKKGRVYMTYQDDEIVLINLFGIRASQVQLLKNEVEKCITKPAA